MINFTIPGTALLFESDYEADPVIHVGCTCNNGKGYHGRLSDIPMMAAMKLVEQKSNLLRLKPGVQNEEASKQS